MRTALLGLATAILVFAGMTAAGLAASLFLVPAPPNIYRTSIYDITLPKGWSCVLEVTESVCKLDGPPPHRAIMIAALKYRNPQVHAGGLYGAPREAPDQCNR